MDIQTVHTRDDDGQHTYRVVPIENAGETYRHTFEVTDDGEHAGHEYVGVGEPGTSDRIP